MDQRGEEKRKTRKARKTFGGHSEVLHQLDITPPNHGRVRHPGKIQGFWVACAS